MCTRLVKPLLGLTALLLLAATPGRAETSRIVILGFDGADANLTRTYMDQGLLPHLARLRDTGTFSPLGTTTPPQTPVSWSSFATGRNPARNGIFDFLRRDLATYQPDFAMYEIGSKPVLWGRRNRLVTGIGVLAAVILIGFLVGALRRRPVHGLWVGTLVGLALGVVAWATVGTWLPYQRPTVRNTRQGDTFWEVAGEHGIASTVVRVPATFPPRAYDRGEILAGLGVPDIRGTFNTFSFYTTGPLLKRVAEDTEMGGKIIEISLLDGEADSYIYGPRNRLFDEPKEILPPVHFKLDRDADPPTVTITTTTETRTVALGAWSDWFTLEFKFNPLVKAYGIARFYFESSEPFGLYMSAVNLDPHRPVMPVSEPPRFSGRLADRVGLYKTLGWAMDTFALNELRIDEGTFLQDVYFTEGKYREIMHDLMGREGDRLYVQVYTLTDRVSHMFWRLLDPSHPAYDADLAARYGNAIQDAYVFMDDVVGEAMERLGPGDILFVCSDHGFHTWRKMVNYNTWLVRNGYMTLKSNAPDTQKTLEDLFGQGQFWPNVDWKRTKAYALGLGDIYLNVRGREAEGIVQEGEEYERIRSRLVQDLEAWIDPENGEHPVRRVITREEAYGTTGYDRNLIPDLIAANSPGYRVSWQTSLGGIPAKLLQENTRKWSGDHCSLDPQVTKGILFCNRKLEMDDPSILDFYPTVLGELGIPVAGDTDGRAWKEAGAE